MTTAVNINARMDAMLAQRNNALNEYVNLAGELADTQAELATTKQALADALAPKRKPRAKR
tara:strand:+ start:1432 stop:1614 length:183 start_codon:yes stop_codon:yes gene_type:complete